MTEFEVWAPHGNAARILHDGLVAEGIIEAESANDFGKTVSEAMAQLERRTREVYGSLPSYKDNLQAQIHALPADPDHPLIWEIANQHISDLVGSSPQGAESAPVSLVPPAEVARRTFLIRNVLAILAQTPQSKRLLAEQLNVSVLYFNNLDSVGIMYWLPDRNRVVIRLRQRNPVRLREVTQLLVTTLKKIGNQQLGNPEHFVGSTGSVVKSNPQHLRFTFDRVQLFTHSVGDEEEIDHGEVVQFESPKSIYRFIWRRRVERVARLAVYVTAALSIAFFATQFVVDAPDLAKTFEFLSQVFGRLFTTALWVVFLQIFVEHGALVRAMRSKGTKFAGGAVVLWGDARRYSLIN
ncbi:hypothetical protein OM076_10265 [Solirubrobacter ginsenosidimutans]|uniref:Uncharacterized protein n=1 Tax=Solirubrobacter ginsenosidimutans TaxID=490573 RepID=A0A9X3RZV5_9ACTN|nr:hypothetical protein [Solirubrobacter ginsenosidimutans]MDA0160649.1 hypothetical protein [Solirubrobacter ginsenosidimutans]